MGWDHYCRTCGTPFACYRRAAVLRPRPSPFWLSESARIPVLLRYLGSRKCTGRHGSEPFRRGGGKILSRPGGSSGLRVIFSVWPACRVVGRGEIRRQDGGLRFKPFFVG